MNSIMIKTLLPFLILLGLVVLFVNKDTQAAVAAKEPSAIHWLSLEEAVLLSEKERKPILVNIHAAWSGGCKKMENETFSKPAIVDYINANYYAVRINADQQKMIKIQNQVIGLPQLSQYLTKVESYPSMIYINKDKVMTTVPGYQNSHDFEMYLRYFGK